MNIAYTCACDAWYRGSVKPDSAALLVAKAIIERHVGPGHELYGEPVLAAQVLANAPCPATGYPGGDSRKEPSV